MEKKIIISVPGPKARGGITGYFYTIQKYYTSNIEYVIRGPRNWPVRKSKISEGWRLLWDFFLFLIKISNPQVKIVQLNTSLGKSGISRDIVFAYLAKFTRKKIIVFFHGWNLDIEKDIEDSWMKLFVRYISLVDAIFTLSQRSKNTLERWGFQNKIYLMSTIVDDSEIIGWDMERIVKKNSSMEDNHIEFLFLARIEKTKGIYEAISVFEILLQKYPNISFNIAGDGSELERVKLYVEEKNIQNINFFGFVSGEEKINLFKRSHIFLFPSYTEGMPTSVLEAMAFGLVVVTRPVGGLIDFFDEKMGLMLDTLNPNVFASNIDRLLKMKLVGIAQFNYKYTKQEFYASIAAKRIEDIYRKLG